jgi:hypothetical protein
VCGMGSEGFASFPCQTDRGLEEERQGGPYTFRKSSMAGRGAAFRTRTSQDNSKEVLGMAKVLPVSQYESANAK